MEHSERTPERAPDIPAEKHAPTASPGLRLGPILGLTGIFYLNFLSRVSFAPLMPALVTDLDLGHAEAGSLFLFLSVGYCAGLLASGLVSSRITHRRTVLVSAAAVGGALLAVSQAGGLWGIRLALLLLGASGGLYLPSGISTLTSLVNPANWGRAIAVHEMAPNLGFVTAPLLTEAVLLWCSWRYVPALLGAASLLACLAFLRYGRGGDFAGEAPSARAVRTLAAQPSFWIVMALFSLGIGASLGVYAVLPLYLVAERGMDREWVNTLVALSRFWGLGAAFLAGWAVDRFGAKRALQGVFLTTGLTTFLLGTLPGTWVVAAVFLQPLAAVCFFPPGFAALAKVGPEQTRNVAVSLTIPVAFLLGGGAIPAGIAWFGDAGSFATGVLLFGAIALGACLLVPLLRLPEKGAARS